MVKSISAKGGYASCVNVNVGGGDASVATSGMCGRTIIGVCVAATKDLGVNVIGVCGVEEKFVLLLLLL